MKAENRYSILNFKKDFPDDEACLDFLFKSNHSKECSCGGVYKRLQGRLQYQCSKCRFQIAPMKRTIFEKSSTPLTLWFHAIFIFSNAKSGISAKEMERQLGVTYKTAWRMLRLIRKSLRQETYKLSGNVEMDETYMGGKGDGGKYNENRQAVMRDKTPVIAAVERGGDIRVRTAMNPEAGTLAEFLDENVSVNDTRLLTDASNRYHKVALEYNRETVTHKKKQYVRGDVHVNHVESFWSHVKRSIKGTHKVVTREYLQEYLNAFVFHYNNRHSDRQRFEALVRVLVG